MRAPLFKSVVFSAILCLAGKGQAQWQVDGNTLATVPNRNVLVKGPTAWVSGSQATLYLGDYNHYVKGVWGSGLRLGTCNVGDVIQIKENTGNVGIGTTDPQVTLDIYEPHNTSAMAGISTSGNWLDAGITIGLQRGTGYRASLVVPGTTNPSSWATGANPGDFVITSYNKLFLKSTGSDNGIVVNSNNVGIGTAYPASGYKLDVNGNVNVNGKIQIKNWSIEAPDYVFEKDYKLRSLSDVEKHIADKKHLPEVPSAAEIKKNGVDLTEMNMLLLKKVEELTLYAIEQNKKLEKLENMIAKDN